MQEIQTYKQQLLKPLKQKNTHHTQKSNILSQLAQFYQKSHQKLSKSIVKQTKKTSIICKQLLQLFNLHPNQQLYELIRLKDIIFNQAQKFNIHISTFIKQFQFIRDKLNQELYFQKQKYRNKIEQMSSKCNQNVNLLQKIEFKRQRTQFMSRVVRIDSVNKKMMRIEEGRKGRADEADRYVLEIEGKAFKYDVYCYFKLWFENKKRYYLAVVYSKEGMQSHISIINDKLQILANINDQVDPTKLVNIILSENHLYIVHQHHLSKINLHHHQHSLHQSFKQTIKAAETYCQDGLILFMQEQMAGFYYLVLDSHLDVCYQEYLKLSVKSIKKMVRCRRRGQEKLYFITVSNNIQEDLYQMTGFNTKCLIKNMVPIQQMLILKPHESCDLMLRGNTKFYIFEDGIKHLRRLSVDIESNEITISNCCILGQHIFVLHQSGKFMLECLFNLEK